MRWLMREERRQKQSSATYLLFLRNSNIYLNKATWDTQKGQHSSETANYSQESQSTEAENNWVII